MPDAIGSEPEVVQPMSASDDVLRVEHLSKRFGPVTALRDISLHLRKGEVLGLLGDNGAGKSTLIKILSGFQKQDGGQMFLHGQPYEPKGVDDARSKGIDTVYQDLALIDELSVYHNLFLRRELVHKPLPFLANRSTSRGSTWRSRASPAASARRSPSRARSTATRTSSCWTSLWRRWAPRRAR
jgi:ABC-type sugar transport system ATPase subunit